MALLRLEFWDKDLDSKFISLKVEAFYDIIKELIFARLYKEGYNCTNHLCLVAYLRAKMKDFEYETDVIDELRAIRNSINYRGLIVGRDYLKHHEIEFKHIITRLKEGFNVNH